MSSAPGCHRHLHVSLFGCPSSISKESFSLQRCHGTGQSWSEDVGWKPQAETCDGHAGLGGERVFLSHDHIRQQGVDECIWV